MPGQVSILYAVNNGFLDAIDPEAIGAYEVELHNYLKTKGRAWVESMNAKPELTEEHEAQLKELLTDFNQTRA